MSEPLPAGLLVRVSSKQQAESDAPAHQRIRGKAYCDTRAWPLVTEYNMENVKGDDAPTHPEYLRMLEDVRTGRVKVVICSYISRLARDFPAMVELGQFFQQHGAHIVSIGEGVDTSTSMGRIFFFLLALFADLEKQKIAERVADVVPIRAALGKKMGGVATFGYDWIKTEDGDALVIREDEAFVRRLIYTLFLQMRRASAVADELNRRGIRTRDDGDWHGGYVTRMIEDPTADGRRLVNWCTKSKDKTNKAPVIKDESDWVWKDAPRLVDHETWATANQILAGQRAEQSPRQKRPKRLFGGHVWCHCNAKMYGDARPTPNQSFRCAAKGCDNRMRIDLLEQTFVEQIDTFFHSPAAGKAQLKRLKASLRDKWGLLKTQRAALEQLARDKDKVQRDHLRHGLPAAYIGEFYQRYEVQHAQLTADIPRLEGEIGSLEAQIAGTERTVSEAQQVRLRWEDFTTDEKHGLIEQIVERIIVGRKWVQIELAYLPDVFALRPSQTASESPTYHTGYLGVSDESKTRVRLSTVRPKAPPRKRRTARESLDALLFPLTLLTLRLLGPGLRWA